MVLLYFFWACTVDAVTITIAITTNNFLMLILSLDIGLNWFSAYFAVNSKQGTDHNFNSSFGDLLMLDLMNTC